MKETGKKLNLIFIFVLILYPLRHIALGIDFNDTGYNYANFQYMGLEHMDPMWLYSTYLATAVGHFLTKLPFGHSLIGMNFYSGLFLGGMAATGFLFCKNKLEMPSGVAFLGEMVALNLCWAPSASMYHYLTYLLLFACSLLLYCGLTKKQKSKEKERKTRFDTGLDDKGNRMLFIAGICLGANVLVRFSNLPEMVFIVAVWAYGFLEGPDNKKNNAWKHTVNRTLLCLGGYLAALAVLFGYIQVRYGIGNYVEGIRRLFAMTENATDYKAKAMIRGMFEDYIAGMYYVVRIAVFLVITVVLSQGARWLGRRSRKISRQQRKVQGRQVAKEGKEGKEGKKNKEDMWFRTTETYIPGAVGLTGAGIMVVWLYNNTSFASFQFYSYDSIFWPSVLFLMLSLLVAVVCIIHPGARKEKKLISGLVILTIFITPLGGNNKIYSIINNLFLVAPYTLWNVWEFLSDRAKDVTFGRITKNIKLKFNICPIPIKIIVLSFITCVIVQSFGFGITFVFSESTGGRNMTEKMEREGALKGVKMSPDRVRIMEQLMDYVEENGLSGTDAIFYGDIPSLSFYLQLPAAFNPWCNLTSYSVEVFQTKLDDTQKKLNQNLNYSPIIVLEKDYAECLQELIQKDIPLAEVEAQDILEIMHKTAGEPNARETTSAEKFALLVSFLDQNQYEMELKNEKAMILRRGRNCSEN